MKEKMKKILCLALSFVLLGSNVQVFAQEVEIGRPLSKTDVYQLNKEFEKVKSALKNFRDSYRYVSRPGLIKGNEVFDIPILRDNVGWNRERATKLNEMYSNFLDKTYSYTDHILEEEGKTALERATYRYVGAPEVTIKHYQLEEGAVFEKLQEIADNLQTAWNNKASVESFLETAKEQEQVIDELISALDNRLEEVKGGVLGRVTERNEAVLADNMAEIIQKHISRENVLSAAMKKIPQEEREAIGLFFDISYHKAGNIRIAHGIRKYLGKMNKPFLPALSELLRADMYRVWDFKRTVSKKWENVIDDFPILKDGKYISPRHTIRKFIRATPLVIVGVVLTAAAITEIRSDNRFPTGAKGVKMMAELKKKIDRGEASFRDVMLYYSDDSSSSVVNKEPEHLINAITLGLAVKQAEKDFDVIAADIQSEVGDEYALLSEEDIHEALGIALQGIETNIELDQRA